MTVFRVGQKVVCVDVKSPTPWIIGVPHSNDMSGLKEREIYTIRAMGNAPAGHLCIWLKEITREIHPIYGEVGYSATRFRPVALTPQSMQHDIELFEDIAKFAKVDEAMRELDTIGDKP